MARHSDNQPTDKQHAAGAGARNVDPKLLEILVCPVSKQALEYDAERHELISRIARLAYPVRDGIPIMLAEEARPLGDDE
jgi:uncharacterized protein YbaR (Trm112 family)